MITSEPALPEKRPRASVGEKYAKQVAQDHVRHVKVGRATILIIAILIGIGGIFVYRQLLEIEQLDPFHQRAGMIQEARNQVRIALGVTIFLFLAYVGLWVWAKWALFPATLIAFLLYASGLAFSAILDPTTLLPGLGFFIRLVILLVLIRAVMSAWKLRRREAKAAV